MVTSRIPRQILKVDRVTSWEHEAKETLSDLIKIAGTTEWTKFVKKKKIENVKLARRSTQLVPQPRSTFPRKLTFHGVDFTCIRREAVERQPNTCKTTKQVDGLARTTKAKQSQLEQVAYSIFSLVVPIIAQVSVTVISFALLSIIID